MRLVSAAMLMCVAAMSQETFSQADKDFSDAMGKAGQMSASGNAAGALNLLQSLLTRAKSDPALKGRDLDVLRAMGRVYLDAKRPVEAAKVYQTMLDQTKAVCIPGNPAAERCADVLYDMGVAQMTAGDFAGAVVTLRKGIPLYEAMIKRGTAEDYKMAKLKLEANTQGMLGAALFRSGDLAGGIAGYEKAVTQYQTVLFNPGSGQGLQLLAKQSLGDAQAALKLLKEEASRRGATEKKAAEPKKK